MEQVKQLIEQLKDIDKREYKDAFDCLEEALDPSNPDYTIDMLKEDIIWVIKSAQLLH